MATRNNGKAKLARTKGTRSKERSTRETLWLHLLPVEWFRPKAPRTTRGAVLEFMESDRLRSLWRALDDAITAGDYHRQVPAEVVFSAQSVASVILADLQSIVLAATCPRAQVLDVKKATDGRLAEDVEAASELAALARFMMYAEADVGDVGFSSAVHELLDYYLGKLVEESRAQSKATMDRIRRENIEENRALGYDVSWLERGAA